ncbi:histone-lysine N-methyltransferase NSD2-like [Pecten maximus]|uniref:histone-lysine N-methyltransferase NSD2-like n=1 Tax=Pecten maximus TaxID=6579 RepID=UPI0014581064|nr:histone-lysine N-methyltransferase NSD2-like [Pecten maximus]XP_033756393.1 histone-lysine N-methyltransferase NSD2-like [Pecten maximus]XP_033756394.1 histone-lysine N-methyltransferase NSD2-like [Pecten maximus]
MDVDKSTPNQKVGDKPLVNGDCQSPAELSDPVIDSTKSIPAGAAVGFRHHLPQIANLTRNTKIAQSKAIAKRESTECVPDVEATLHVEGTGKVVKLDADLKTELCVQEAGDVSPGTGDVAKTEEHAEKEKSEDTSKSRSGKKVRKPASAKKKSASESQNTGENIDSKPSPEKPSPANQSYKNIFQETVILGKRNRKPKKIDFEEEEKTSPKAATSSARKKAPEKKVEAVSETVSKMEEDKPAQWLVGDVLWGKVPGHPWWPCMVAYDPFQGLYTKFNKRVRLYHVQYFGHEEERGWLFSSSIMEFQGWKQYEDRKAEALKNAKKHEKARLEKLYRVSNSRMAAWKIAIKEAEEALPMSRNERKQHYTYIYESKDSGDSKKVNDKGETDIKIEENNSLKDTKKRKRRAEKEEPSITATAKRKKVETANSSEPLVSPRQGSGDGSFDVFCQKHRDSAKEEHPDLDETALMAYLKQQWCMMSKKQKARYRSKFTSDQGSPEPQRKLASGRISKPTTKFLEMLEETEEEELSDTSNKKPTPKSKTSTRSGRHPATPDSRSSLEGTSNSVATGPTGVQEKTSDTVLEEVKEEATTTTVPPTVPVKVNRRRKSAASSVDTDSNTDTQEDSKPVIPVPKVATKEPEEEYELEIFKLSSRAPPMKESLCEICHKVGDLVICEGQCQGSFHKDCLGLSVAPSGVFRCDECTTGNHTCFCCKKADKDTRICTVPACGKFYHENCVNKCLNARTESKGLVCPLHSCATCSIDNPKSAKNTNRGKLLRCVQCPTAYHVGEFCIAAGSEVLPGYNILCSKHFQPLPSQRHHSHVNLSWCFVCNRGGSLLCCESCPAAFHAECLKMDHTPEGSWYCHDCTQGKRPLYGDIIWVKLGNYRWWPGEICCPHNVPLNIQEKSHQVGEFPVRFFGSHDFFWIHMGRVFSFQEGDKGSKESSLGKHLAKVFSNGVKEAMEAYKLWKKAKENKEQIEQQKNDRKPAPYRFIKTNIPLGSVQIYKADLSEIPRCECRPDQENACSTETDCFNRMLMYECNPTVCPAGEKCQNQRFQKRSYPDSVPFKTAEGRGWGLKTLVDVKKGQFVNEYVGDLIDEQEVKRRIDSAHENNISNFYMLTLDKNRIIDAGPKGNLSRFMNHCCNPNCETQKWTVNGDVRVGLFALHDIPAGSELTFNYNLECLGNDKTACCCGAPNCSGFLGVRPKTAAAVANERRAKEASEAKKKKRKPKKIKTDIKKEHEDECFRCGEGGELVMCDKAGCPKVYHLQCLKLNRPPHGSWYCPWHHCDTCGKVAVNMCQECPNSFCQHHTEDNLVEVNRVLLCLEHEDTEVTSSSCASSVVSDSQSDAGEANDTLTENTAENSNHSTADSHGENGKGETSKTLDTKKSGKTVTKNLPSVNIPHKAITNLDRKRSLNKKDSRRKRQLGSDVTQEAGGKKGRKADCVEGRKPHGGKGDPLAVAPMFDDSDDDGFSNLVIDIPQIN